MEASLKMFEEEVFLSDINLNKIYKLKKIQLITLINDKNAAIYQLNLQVNELEVLSKDATMATIRVLKHSRW